VEQDIDMENEPLIKKRERQRSLVLHLENIGPLVPDAAYLQQPRRSFSSFSSAKIPLKGHHDVDKGDDDDEEITKTTSTSELEDEGGKDIDYSVLYDENIEDFSYTQASREQAKKRLLKEQQEEMHRQQIEQQQQ